MATKFGVNLRVTLMGSWGCLPYMRKYGLKPVAEFQVQLYVWTNAAILPS